MEAGLAGDDGHEFGGATVTRDPVIRRDPLEIE
jgi:hypothetical protein